MPSLAPANVGLPIMLGGVFNMGGSAVVNCVSILEAVK
jgi:hypothetical protein